MPGRRKILVLDVDDSFLIELERLLENEGVETTTTREPGLATAMTKSGSFDLVVIGDHPPEVDARVWLRQLKETSRSPRCLVLHPASLTRKESAEQTDVVLVYESKPREVVKVVAQELGFPHRERKPEDA